MKISETARRRVKTMKIWTPQAIIISPKPGYHKNWGKSPPNEQNEGQKNPLIMETAF